MPIPRHTYSVRGGVILNSTINPVDQPASSGGTGATDHSHPNLTLLNSLNVDPQERLRIGTNIIHPPLDQKDW